MDLTVEALCRGGPQIDDTSATVTPLRRPHADITSRRNRVQRALA